MCECLPLASVPSIPAPNLTLQHWYITFIMLISWRRGRSGQLQTCTFSLPKWVQNTQQAPQNPPECQISSKCQWFRYNIKYIAFRWGIGGFELGGEVSETGWVGCSRGRSLDCWVFYNFHGRNVRSWTCHLGKRSVVAGMFLKMLSFTFTVCLNFLVSI